MKKLDVNFGWLSLRLQSESGKLEKIEFLPADFALVEKDEDKVLQIAVKQLHEYFKGERQEFSVPLNLQGTVFQKKVWQELQRIPYGTTISYGKLAERIGKPKAARAVGMANHVNPVPFIVPCHRVIGADGSLTGYAGGLEIKRRLLELEQAEYFLY